MAQLAKEEALLLSSLYLTDVLAAKGQGGPRDVEQTGCYHLYSPQHYYHYLSILLVVVVVVVRSFVLIVVVINFSHISAEGVQ